MEEGGPMRIKEHLNHQTPRGCSIDRLESNRESEMLLRQVIKTGLDNTMNRIFLAELLIDVKKHDEAKSILEKFKNAATRDGFIIEEVDAIKQAKDLLAGMGR